VEAVHVVEHANLPAVYQLPAFSTLLKEKLQNKELTPEIRRLIVNALYEDVAKLTLLVLHFVCYRPSVCCLSV